MKIEISQQALKWFKDELEVKKGDHLRFFAKIYGNSSVQPGYALGFSIDDPIDIAVQTELDGIVFFVEETDLWFFDSHDLHVEYNEKIDEIEFNYIK
ncbi:HesB/YadR/YfhF family protein [Neobacillus sp. PS3-12]|uniref:HesB/YadR/YfhF family protein n=1 Tax=Neobacillus sp. PS3-12 TaxID=3070677 RepID=UPI0027DF0B9D|nr:HesB/YadR/YfhF family protein [Neobacillus sp. PS3-12]WML54673.1 HesB/YadR/YfhF family protein [Neobacillus sp. PS3-12]